jgi:nucleoside-diphosphate-sugar epimerase
MSAKKVLVTGANGNLGTKLVAHLATASWCGDVVAVCFGGVPDLPSGTMDHVTVRTVDLTDPSGTDLAGLMAGVDAVVHLAAQRPFPDATWIDSTVSFDMTLNVVAAAEAAGVPRLVFASSNHVMGGYKETADQLRPGGLTVDMMPWPGTLTTAQDGSVSSSVAYATAKLMGERLCVQRAKAGDGRLSCVSLRIGWCQPGENSPATLSATGLPGVEVELDDPAVARAERWFRGMWLSNRDFLHLVERGILADAIAWPAPGIVVNGMSANRDMVWDIETTRRMIGYQPSDDAEAG